MENETQKPVKKPRSKMDLEYGVKIDPLIKVVSTIAKSIPSILLIKTSRKRVISSFF